MKQVFAGDQAQHGVTQELELFVVPDPVLRLNQRTFELASLRAVGEGLLEQLKSDDATSKSLLEFGDVACFRPCE